MVQDAEKANIQLTLGDDVCTTCIFELRKANQDIQVTPMEVEYQDDEMHEDLSYVEPAENAPFREPMPSTSSVTTECSAIQNIQIRGPMPSASSVASESALDTSIESEVTDIIVYQKNTAFLALNKCIQNLDEQPIIKERLRSVAYSEENFERVKNVIGREIFDIEPNKLKLDAARIDNANTGEEILAQLKEKFLTASKKEKMLILTTLPISWNEAKIVEHFNVTYYMAKTARNIQRTKGVMSVRETKLGPKLPQQTVETVKQFYRDDQHSQVCPGKKDYQFVTEDGEKQAIQRRLVLFNLNEGYEIFKQKHPGLKIGFTKFTMLRPKECLLAMEKGGTHNVCVCMAHQNVKLLFDPMKQHNLLPEGVIKYHSFIDQMICMPPTELCHRLHCEKCPSFENLSRTIADLIAVSEIEQFSFKQWVSSDRE